MKHFTFLFTILSLTFYNILSSQTNQNNDKIGIIFKIEGPYKIYRDAIYNITSKDGNSVDNDKYADAIYFFKTEKVNPTEKLKEYYMNQIKLNGFDPILLSENLTEDNFPAVNSKTNKQYSLDMTILKRKYNIDRVLIVIGIYGLEFENIGIFDGDKRTNISLSNFVVNTNDNDINKKFQVGNIKNIKKKNLLSPPDYPNIVESMNRLLNERIFPEIKLKLKNL